jgi:hypothetical protein
LLNQTIFNLKPILCKPIYILELKDNLLQYSKGAAQPEDLLKIMHWLNWYCQKIALFSIGLMFDF